MENPKNLKELIQQGYVTIAKLPKKNDFPFERLDSLRGYTVPLIDHDYSAATPLMWNTLYESLGLPIRNIMVVGDPKKTDLIFSALRQDPKYLGGGIGSGFKEVAIKYLDSVSPRDLKSVNIAVNENGSLIGYNTDAQGFVQSLEDKFSEINKSVSGGTYVILGAGGVAKEVTRLIARLGASKIRILNRTATKAVQLAYELNQEFQGLEAIGAGEDIIRGYILNSFNPPNAIINLTNKGSDGPYKDFSAFSDTESLGHNISNSRTIARELKNLNPNVIIADITLSKDSIPKTLAIAKNEGLANIIDGWPMVVNQAAPAYVYVQNAHPSIHLKKVSESEALEVFKKATKN